MTGILRGCQRRLHSTMFLLKIRFSNRVSTNRAAEKTVRDITSWITLCGIERLTLGAAGRAVRLGKYGDAYVPVFIDRLNAKQVVVPRNSFDCESRDVADRYLVL